MIFDFQEALHQQGLARINEGFREFQLGIESEDGSWDSGTNSREKKRRES